ncbi:MAG: phosphatase [Cephaloticoccus sp.]|nr:phosphatase [Cephaloticoccus sp.]
MSDAPKVAVIDIGSNSIKALVARRGTNCRRVKPVHEQTIDARISAGINRAEPRLSPEGMAAGLNAIRQLLDTVAPFSPVKIQLVATSAVRDALNRDDFLNLVRNETGHAIRILTGTEEAACIGRGLLADPALAGVSDCYVFDLGGGSLECLRLRNHQLETALSLPLGCVRLTEKFVTDRLAPLASAISGNIKAYVARLLAEADFAFSLPPGATAIGTGGTLYSCRAILAHRAGLEIEQSSPIIAHGMLVELAAELAAMPLDARNSVPGLPPARADVFPAALFTFLGVMESGHIAALHHSKYNLRYGIADELMPA